MIGWDKIILSHPVIRRLKMARNSLKNVIRLIDVEKQELSPEKAFLNDLKRSIEITEQKNKRKPSPTYKPSSMNCMRQSYYQITEVDPDDNGMNYNFIGICNSGTDIHVRIQTAVDHMKENDIDCEYIDVGQYIKERKLKNIEVRSKDGMETKLYHKKLNLSFMCDGIIRYRGHYYILELKTENSNKFWTRNEVDPSHYKQATAYSIALEINDVLFVYISRDTLAMKSFMFTPPDYMKHDLIAYIDTCDSYLKKLKVPPKDGDNKTCSYCNYKNQCRKDGE